MENPEELLHSLEEFSKLKPRDIPRDLEEYLCFVAKTGDPIYQWATIKTLFREKLINVITEFYESCASMEIPACPNVEIFNYETMKNFILEKLDTFVAAPFTVQRICELLTAPRKEYNRIDKYMRALEKNILVVSTTEPGGRSGAKNGDSVMNGIDSDHTPETSHCNNDINVEEMDDSPSWRNGETTSEIAESTSFTQTETETAAPEEPQLEVDNKDEEPITTTDERWEVRCTTEDESETSSSVTITAVPAGVQKRRSSVEPDNSTESTTETPQAEDVPEAEKETPVVESNEAENKQEVSKEEPRIILTTTDSGIENISPESSTSSPETLQNEFESAESSAVSTYSEKPSSLVEVADPEPSSINEEPIGEDVSMTETKEVTNSEVESTVSTESQELKDFEVSSSDGETSSESTPVPEITSDVADTLQDIPEVDESTVETTEPKLTENVESPTPSPKPQSEEEKTEVPMEVDSSSDKAEEDSTEISSV